jgi:hypothetical protein
MSETPQILPKSAFVFLITLLIDATLLPTATNDRAPATAYCAATLITVQLLAMEWCRNASAMVV